MTEWWFLNAFLIVSYLNPLFFSKSLLCPGNAPVVLQNFSHPRAKDEAEEELLKRQIINAVLWETRFWFLHIGYLADLRLYWGFRVVKETKDCSRVLGISPFLSHAFQFLKVWINLSAWVDTSWSITYWKDSSMEGVPAFKKVLILSCVPPPKKCLSPDLCVIWWAVPHEMFNTAAQQLGHSLKGPGHFRE